MNVSDRRLAEEALRENQAQLAGIIGSAMDAIVSIDEQQRVVLFNAAAENVFGCSAAEAAGQPLSRFISTPFPDSHLDHPPGLQQERGAGLQVGSFASLMGRRAGGEDFPIDVSISEVELNREHFYTIILRDITERLRAEAALKKALEEVSQLKNKLEEENIYLREEINVAHNYDEIVGRSDATKYVLFKIEQVAPTDSTVLITGETGTGKELVARAIHSSSLRQDRPLVRVNCAALSPTLIESELFGHEKGAFTGASARKLGRFELANGATLFLDEIGELPLELQSKLLRVIQEGEFERLGSSKTIKVDARIIAATNRNLKIAVEQGTFREDLWYRLNVFPITVPPLRDRKEDIPDLIEHFVRRFSRKLGREISSIAPISLRLLNDYAWPGNVRELANVLERAVINTNGTVLRIVDHFEQPPMEEQSHSNKTLQQMEKEYIIRILHSTGWRIDGAKGAARILGLNASTLRTRMAKLGIQKVDGKTMASVV
jgi:PAS domain S-box-containing protein